MPTAFARWLMTGMPGATSRPGKTARTSYASACTFLGKGDWSNASSARSSISGASPYATTLQAQTTLLPSSSWQSASGLSITRLRLSTPRSAKLADSQSSIRHGRNSMRIHFRGQPQLTPVEVVNAYTEGDNERHGQRQDRPGGASKQAGSDGRAGGRSAASNRRDDSPTS